MKIAELAREFTWLRASISYRDVYFIFRYNVMNQCWTEEPDTRPTFQELGVSVAKIIKDARNSIKNRQKHQKAADADSGAGPSSSNPQYQNSMGAADTINK